MEKPKLISITNTNMGDNNRVWALDDQGNLWLRRKVIDKKVDKFLIIWEKQTTDEYRID